MPLSVLLPRCQSRQKNRSDSWLILKTQRAWMASNHHQMFSNDMDPIKELLESSESSIQGMTARRAVFKLAEAIAVVKRSRSWEWIGDWMISRGVKSKDGSITPRVLANYLSAAKKAGLIDDGRVEAIAQQLDEHLRVETLSKIGQDEAVRVLRDAFPQKILTENQREKPATQPPPPRIPSGPDPEFEEIRQSILENLGRPESQRLAMIQVGGKTMIVPIAAQAKVRDGKITSLDELHEAMNKRK